MSNPGPRSRNAFIERSITGALSFFRDSLFAEEYAHRRGFLQAREPRIKAAGIMLFIACALLARHSAVVACLYALCLFLAAFSRIPLKFFLKRTWFFIPLFSLVIALPALFNIVTPGDALVSFSLAGRSLSITRQGLFSAGLFVARVTTCVSFAVLLSITTRHTELLKALRMFGVPSLFVLILHMCYRYLFLFMQVIEHTYRALKCRIGGRLHYSKGQRIVAFHLTGFWQRSLQMHQEVYNAMLSRGYRGEPQVLEGLRVTVKDWAWAGVAVALCAAGAIWLK